MQCPLCGFRFSKEDQPCHRGCPLRSHCNIECCPHCGYEFAGESKVLGWLKRRLQGQSHGASQG